MDKWEDEGRGVGVGVPNAAGTSRVGECGGWEPGSVPAAVVGGQGPAKHPSLKAPSQGVRSSVAENITIQTKSNLMNTLSFSILFRK